MPIHWRALTTLDLPSVQHIATQVHPDFPEDDAVFAERQRLYPEGARLLELAGEPAGYVFSHPWRLGDFPALNTRLGLIPPDADTYYLHDLALLPAARGTGAAGLVVADLARHAGRLGFASMSLVAVNGSQPFWKKHGFEPVADEALAGKLASYEASARFMVRPLA